MRLQQHQYHQTSNIKATNTMLSIMSLATQQQWPRNIQQQININKEKFVSINNFSSILNPSSQASRKILLLQQQQEQLATQPTEPTQVEELAAQEEKRRRRRKRETITTKKIRNI
jgi:hypothetical protein